ncbi:phosphatidylinositol N-acetylglucosaminyltransferase subunit A-like, partial [Paramuricea clavata]
GGSQLQRSRGSQLQVISTKVGGVPEVLPRDMIRLVEPNVPDLVLALEQAIKAAGDGDVVSPTTAHERIKKMYTWDKVARRTEMVYDSISNSPISPLEDKLKRWYECGVVAGKIYCFLAIIDLLFLLLLNWLIPEQLIDKAPEVRRDQKLHDKSSRDR